jgi:hypothetical protein
LGPPTSVDLVLGNPRVRLLGHSSRGTRVIKRAPTAADLAGRGTNYYLDRPGNPLEPGCAYARDFAALRRAGHAPAVTYAHLAREPGQSGLAVQYWFYYYGHGWRRPLASSSKRSACSPPDTGSRAGSSRPICARTEAWSQ